MPSTSTGRNLSRVTSDDGCGARMVAMGIPNHTHICTGPHDAGDHYCIECGRYFWHAMEALGERES